MPNIFQQAASTAGVDEVRLNDELRRIEALPRRLWEDNAERFADELTAILRTTKGTMRLRPIQAVALVEIGSCGGLFGPLRVGSGKTLISLLAPQVSFAKRPLLLVPAALVGKTRRDEGDLRAHWRLPDWIRVISYEWLGRAQASKALEEYAPDLIVADEAHRLKNPKAAVTRRVRRYMLDAPDTAFVAMSGTVTKRSLHDFAHLIRWTHSAASVPLPRAYGDLERWADALDERKNQLRRASPGALRVLCNEDEDHLWSADPKRAARLAFRRRLVETPGVVATKETSIDATILVRGVEPPHSRAVDQAFSDLRYHWTTPDGWPIADGLALNRHAREIALGFHYVWDPRPPRAWLEARRAWCAFVRRTLQYSKTLDSELQVRRAHADATECRDWIEIRDTFKPRTVAEWIDGSVAEYCADWAFANKGIVWCEHTCFGDLLHSLGVKYYGRKGETVRGEAIEDAPTDRGIAASIASNSTGRNLQAWSRNLVASPPANGLQWEQLIGRTHREGQDADEVSFEVLTACAEHVGSVWQAVRDSHFVHDATGSPQKLLVADLDLVTQDASALRSGARWDKQF